MLSLRKVKSLIGSRAEYSISIFLIDRYKTINKYLLSNPNRHLQQIGLVRVKGSPAQVVILRMLSLFLGESPFSTITTDTGPPGKKPRLHHERNIWGVVVQKPQLKRANHRFRSFRYFMTKN